MVLSSKSGSVEFRGEVLNTNALIKLIAAGHTTIFVSPSTTVALPAQTMAKARGITIEVQGTNGSDKGAPAPDNGPYNVGKLPPTDVNPATGLPWGVRKLGGGPILDRPIEERRPEGYADSAFRTPANGQSLYRSRLRSNGSPASNGAPAATPSAPAVAPLSPTQQSPASVPSVLARGEHSGGEWGPPLTADQENPAMRSAAPSVAPLPPIAPTSGAPVAPLPPVSGGTVFGTPPSVAPLAPVSAAPAVTPMAPVSGNAPAVTPLASVASTPPVATVAAPSRHVEDANAPLNPITVDLIENSLKSTRYEMDAVLFRTAMSPAIREQHDEFPLVATPGGKMVVGQFGSFIAGFLDNYTGTIEEGDVFFTNDPYSCDGAVSHLNDWLVLLPIFYENDLVGWASMFGHMSDIGGAVPGSMPIGARTIHEEGVIVKPFKLYDKGVLDSSRLDFILNQCRLPDWNRSDLFGIVSACRVAEKRVRELCDRFGPKTYIRVLDALLDRNYRAMRELIRQNIPETPQSFEDYVDDDGQGFGPYKLKCTVWREGDKAIFDWEGTDPQSPAAISFLFNTEMHKMFVGTYMIMLFDPQIVFNDGFYDLIEVRIPRGSLLKPVYPTALNGRTHTLGRVFDVFGAALGKHSPKFLNAAGFSTSPHLFYSGYDQAGEWYQLFQIGFGGVPGRPAGDGLDGHSLWPEFNNIPNEYLESYFPLIIERYECVQDSGGAGLHRGGNGINQVYRFLADGEISNHDDRWLTYPWGVVGGKPGQRGRKILVRPDGRQVPLPAKADHIKVKAGDVLHFITWGGGGWGDPLERPPEHVRLDVLRGFVSEQKAQDEYGVVVYENGEKIDEEATELLRADIRATRPPLQDFDFGRSIEEILATCKEETGLEPPERPVFRAIPG